ncbi:MAG: ATPase, partial [Phenylobacterium sp.]|nr:ATPase [Phenylobacterium sp.]
MAGRGGKSAARTPGQKRGGEANPGSRPPPTFAFARLAILTTLLLMAVYTAFAVARIDSEPTQMSQRGVVLPGEAQALAARLDAEAATLRGGVLAAR